MAEGASKHTGRRKLTVEQQHFIVTQLACYTQLRDVAAEFEEEFGFTVERNVIGRYDPTKRYNTTLSKKLVDLFFATRKNYEQGLLDMHPISKKVYRVDRLGRMFERAYDRGNHPLAAQLLKQAADEVSEIREHKEKARRWGQGDRIPPDEAEDFDDSETEVENMKQVLTDFVKSALGSPSAAKH